MTLKRPHERKFNAYLDQMNIIAILFPKTYYKGNSDYFFLENDNEKIQLEIQEKIELKDKIKYICRSKTEPKIGKQYWVVDEYGDRADLKIGAVIRTDEFDQKFYYDGSLGMDFKAEKTTFKIWAPTAVAVKVNLYTPNLTPHKTIAMVRLERGVWKIEIEEELEHYYYSFSVCVNNCWVEAVDPYAVALSANGEYGAIVDLKKTTVERAFLPSLESNVDVIIYETHIRDFTIHHNSGVKNKGKYLGAAELNTNNGVNNPTCLSYVRDLGVTHIEFLPVNDFAGVDELLDIGEYNWGYNPLHFNVPEGSYSTDPRDPYARIIELKELISRLHEQGLRVILDVVYNHVYIREESSFEKIVPGYFFRHDHHGMPANGTGVGNDFASERLMARKFILDSVKFWKEEYHVDGFRFDLMGILDIDTMNAIRTMLDQYNTHTLIIGEGWDLNTPIKTEQKANIRNQRQLPQIGQFNDWFRDSIKGSTFNLYDRGYAMGNVHYYESAKRVLAGSIGMGSGDEGLFGEPTQSVNYVESHDNHTFWDKMNNCLRDEGLQLRKRRQRLATVMVLLAQGIPFLHSGQEFFRTKQGVGNSYISPNYINQLNWDEMVVNQEHVEYIKGIIAIRKSHRAFRLPEARLIRKHMSFIAAQEPVISYLLDDVSIYGRWERILVCFNPTDYEVKIQLPDKEWKVLADDNTAGLEPMRIHEERSLLLMPCSSYILVF